VLLVHTQREAVVGLVEAVGGKISKVP